MVLIDFPTRGGADDAEDSTQASRFA